MKKIKITDCFKLHKIVESGQCFRAWELEDGWFRFISADKILDIKQVSENEYLANWTKYWLRYFDLDRQYSAIMGKDKFMNRAVSFGKGIRILHQDPWEMLISFIISQRKSIPAQEIVRTIKDNTKE